ncbi:MAG: hypothetical protein Q9182_000831 [Xanthomendoza sp. 2 TL-2023]
MTLFDTKLFDQTALDYLQTRSDSSALDRSEMPARYLVSIQWPSATATAVPALPARPISVDLENMNDYRKPVLDSPHLDALLDGCTRDTDPPTGSDRSTEENYVQTLQVMAHANEIVVSYTSDQVAFLPELVCGVLRQFCYKAVSLWETTFDNLRSWVVGRRNKRGFLGGFLRQKGIMARSLADLYSSIESYNHASPGWLGMAFPLVNLATDRQSLLRHLEFHGEGIDLKAFREARQITSTNVAVIQVSTVNGDRALNSTSKVVEATFSNIIAQWPYSTSPQDAGSFQMSFENDLFAVVDEETLRQQTQARILKLKRSLEQGRASLKAQEQKVQSLEEELDMELKFRNLLGEILTNPDETVDDIESHGVTPVVEPMPDAIFEPEPTEDQRFGTLDALVNDDPPEFDNNVSTADPPTITSIKKRKRFSILGAAKKARHDHSPLPPQPATHGPTANSNNTINHPPDPDPDPDTPTPTTRPASWPRTLRFRRSAGVSVKKLTDVFEKLRAA